MKKWLLLVYRIPREPTAGRVFIWRKLKQLGAIALQDAIWVLPQTSRTQEQFQEAQSRDYFASKLGLQTREKLLKAGGRYTS